MKKEDISKFATNVKNAMASGATNALGSKTMPQIIGASLLGAGVAAVIPVGLTTAMGLGAAYGAYKAFTTGAIAHDIESITSNDSNKDAEE